MSTDQEQKPDTAKILETLKDFQLQTVDYVYRRLYEDCDAVKRFLVADEVGLGKTLVARGVIARMIDRLWQDPKRRIDIVYICANRDIARQNINRLNITGERDLELTTRLTLLPVNTQNLQNRRLNFVSFTPGTSFNLRSRGGIAEERALIYHILRQGGVIDSRTGPINLLQCGKGKDSWRSLLARYDTGRIDQGLAENYLAIVQQDKELLERIYALSNKFSYHRKHIPVKERRERLQLVGDLRRLLAESCIFSLEPDLVILDEFQRFKYLLEGDDDVANLARRLFNFPDARVLLLSATPYKMYTMHYERGESDHYSDFLSTIGFLFDSKKETEAFADELAAYRKEILRFDEGSERELLCTKEAIEKKLQRVMVRTERLAVTADRNGMIMEAKDLGELTPEELKSFAVLDRVANILGSGDVVEYWKSAPYLLSFMDKTDYQIKRRFISKYKDDDYQKKLIGALGDGANALLPWETISDYHKVDPCNSKLRILLDRTVESGAWQLLWIPPSLPYYKITTGPYAAQEVQDYTKSLVFSSWKVVPKVIAALCSYEAERRMVRAGTMYPDYTEERKTRARLLEFNVSEGQCKGMSVFTLLYPCLTLAERVNPLQESLSLINDGNPVEINTLISVMEKRLSELLFPVLDYYSTPSYAPDRRWYWAALVLLDKYYYGSSSQNPAFLWLESLFRDDRGDLLQRAQSDSGDGFSKHVELLFSCLQEGEKLGSPPRDLIPVITKIALGSPAVVILRSLLNLYGVQEFMKCPVDFLDGAARVANGFRTLFNLSDTITLIRKDELFYWESVLDYCINGNLQAVMDEYLHILREALGLFETPVDEAVMKLSQEIAAAVSIKTVSLSFDEFKQGEINSRGLRCRFALRFGDAKNAYEQGETRSDQVRSAFNSPFRPFILATTSIGQEGLDFHQYCHEVYHWNLPFNPVDLEQREGRIHRYKGHVIRRNIASTCTLASLKGKIVGLQDPWQVLFTAAHSEDSQEKSDIVPFWIYEDGGHKIVRHIPALPLSREVSRLNDLKRTLVAYRMVLGQPRQEDLLHCIESYLSGKIDADDLVKFRIDLSPPSCSHNS